MVKHALMLLLLLFGSGVCTAATTQEDIDKVEDYIEGRGIYTILLQDSPFFRGGVCDGTYYINHKIIHTECGKGTSLDSFLAVMLHEIGHSLQKLEDVETRPSHEERYNVEVTAWTIGKGVGIYLGVWDNLDKSSYEIQKGIGLISYRRLIKDMRNFIH